MACVGIRPRWGRSSGRPHRLDRRFSRPRRRGDGANLAGPAPAVESGSALTDFDKSCISRFCIKSIGHSQNFRLVGRIDQIW
jgi:hypothetical protein